MRRFKLSTRTSALSCMWLIIMLAVVVGAGCTGAPDNTAGDAATDFGAPEPLETASAPAVTSSPDESPIPAASIEDQPADAPDVSLPRPGDDVQSAIVHARELLQSGELRQFVEWYVPVDDLREIRARGEMDRMVSMLGAEVSPVVPALVELLEFLEGQTPRMQGDGGVAVYSLDEFVFGSVEAAADAPPPAVEQPEMAEAFVPPGYGDDLSKVLSAAVADLEAGAVEVFVLKMFPQHEALTDVTEQLAANPQMTDAMLADLRALAELTPEMDDTGGVATFTFSGEGPYRPDRVVKFELVSDDWRLYDAAAPIREIVLVQSQKEPTWTAEVDAQYELRFERLADNWRMVDMPDFTLLMSRPRIDGTD